MELRTRKSKAPVAVNPPTEPTTESLLTPVLDKVEVIETLVGAVEKATAAVSPDSGENIRRARDAFISLCQAHGYGVDVTITLL